MIKKLGILLVVVLFSFSFAAENDNVLDAQDKAEVKKIKQQIKQEKDIALKKEKEEQKQEQLNANQVDIENMVEINILLEKIAKIELSLKDNILLKRYSNYLSYGKIVNELDSLKNSLKSKNTLSEEQEYQLHNKIRVKENELELIAEYKGSPIGGLINPPEIEKYENITNPFGIINALSNIKKLENNKKQFKSLEAEIQALASTLEDELVTYLELFNLDPKLEYKDKITFLDKQKKDFTIVLDIVDTTEEVYTRKIEQIILEIKNQVSQQVQKMFTILVIIIILSIISFLVKLTLRKYFSQNENFYMINKIINFSLVFLIVMVVLFSYIDNVSYLVTILGFASAGIAIALKDWFMSIFGWMVIVTSGFIQVGDRIRVTKGGVETVGDVLDISLFKITIREDVTMISYTKNRRAGRIYFVPNNYIFSELIANYSHSELRTVWDGIDITITFDSNHKKAQKIAREILKHYSKGYSDITRKQLSKMRNKYQLRATGVEPRVFTLVEPHGIVISSWYLTNSYAALVLRSTISPEILDAFMKEDDIHIAYPTQQININDTQNAYGPSRERRTVPQDLEDIITKR
ncbi:mechanosensitive ion channel family protein [Aliarcobacter butzleri]|uniref:mechanosensitive ion channel family protein n=1 Tax=Aliarcobacter butzleri TaxID=28197 RepID=UPI00125F547E|nr:mechanosensitive ion channel domain-containing protein [Aliarcobacter butzleri]MCT7550198.1 mechanosensitive ion channel family protein [Aliarcobacter butzleri]MCT7558018.1 mechanosensitive ion channel family protein [Aliarcobacter butzleri]MCT7595282.1 mechanosensitive ion channel family protein [Aliarcobacter butzleri]MCT7599480.1 mechanosensitive ion channel family protein [Aliarcobacter butzleri]MCT7626636.1 mechanosensitive ion channel family protein [Aliarcobacter butzleri]